MERLPPINTLLSDPLPDQLMPAIQGQQANGYVRDTASSASSAVSSPTLTSSDSSVVFTPVSSRRPSMSTVLPRSTRRGPRKNSHTTTASPGKDGFRPKCEQCGKTACAHIIKARKERANRRNQGARLQDLEDLFQNFLGVGTDRKQSPGNHNAAGLDITKIGILESAVAAFGSLIQDGYERALGEGNLEAWRKNLVQRINNKVAQGHPLADTWLVEDAKAPICDHDRHSKQCTVHGHEDWCQCRKMRRGRFFSTKTQEKRASLAAPRCSL